MISRDAKKVERWALFWHQGTSSPRMTEMNTCAKSNTPLLGQIIAECIGSFFCYITPRADTPRPVDPDARALEEAIDAAAKEEAESLYCSPPKSVIQVRRVQKFVFPWQNTTAPRSLVQSPPCPITGRPTIFIPECVEEIRTISVKKME